LSPTGQKGGVGKGEKLTLDVPSESGGSPISLLVRFLSGRNIETTEGNKKSEPR